MIIFQIFLILARAENGQICSDGELADQCVLACEFDFITCKSECDTNNCETLCFDAFSECNASCPCGRDCPLGCQDCDHPLCTSDLSETNILVVPDPLSESYLTTGDGATISDVKISSPNDNVYMTKHALVQDKLHIFGGTNDRKQISRLEKCSFMELPHRLSQNFNQMHSVMSIFQGNEALICFGGREDQYACWIGLDWILFVEFLQQ
ncbi:unnamed protein product [Oikopleura dioica]|uniref:Uncharacterized protein n=1 Tax=Oikopleura dioica TaxID=34765 RepID=E4Y6J1_OIKDI|nr:unnamed protein product [Oikopleura dioica]